MSYGQLNYLGTVAIASGGTLSTALPMGGKAYNNLCIRVGTFGTATNFALFGSVDNSSFYNIYQAVNTATVQANFVSWVGSAGGQIVILSPGQHNVPYIKFRAYTTQQDNGVSFAVYGYD